MNYWEQHTGLRMAECLARQAEGYALAPCRSCQAIRDSFAAQGSREPTYYTAAEQAEAIAADIEARAAEQRTIERFERAEAKRKAQRKAERERPRKPPVLSCTFACAPITRRARSFLDWLGADDRPKLEPNERLRRARSLLVRRAKSEKKTPWHFLLRAPYVGKQTALEICALLTLAAEPHRHCRTCTCFATPPSAHLALARFKTLG